MPQLATITINDGAATPAATAFVPIALDNGVAKLAFREPNDGHIHLDRKITLSSKDTGDGGKRVTLKVSLPIVHTSDDTSWTDNIRNLPDDVFNCSFKMSQYDDKLARQDLLAFAANLLNDAAVSSLVVDAEGMW